MRCTDCHSSDTTTDPMGPHGSATKYILANFTAKSFIYLTGNGTVSSQTTSPGSGDQYQICSNCHRMDVYGSFSNNAPANKTYSRQSHPVDSSNIYSLSTFPRWGIGCMNCHGGARAGGIHGENLGMGGGAASGVSYAGRRLLGGANWYEVTRGSTQTAGSCWTNKTTDAVNNCNHATAGVAFQSGVANYDYQSTQTGGTP